MNLRGYGTQGTLRSIIKGMFYKSGLLYKMRRRAWLNISLFGRAVDNINYLQAKLSRARHRASTGCVPRLPELI